MKMRLAIGIIATSIIFLIPLFANHAFAQSDDPCADLELIVKGGHNDPTIQNIKKPKFSWDSVEGAKTYQLIISGSPIPVGEATNFQPVEELAYGWYEGSVKVIFTDNTECIGPITKFPIGLIPPVLHKPSMDPSLPADDPSKIMWNQRPEFSFWGSKGATSYIIVIDGQDVATVDFDPAKDAKVVEMILANKEDESALYHWSPPEDFKFEPGTQHTWVVIATNEFQRVRSEKAEFQITKLEPPVLKTPENGFSITVRSIDDIPKLTWDHPQREYDIDMEIFFVDSEGKESPEDKDLDLVEYNEPDSMGSGTYKWFVMAYKEGQQAKSEVWEFTLKKPIGLRIGWMVGFNVFRTTNPLSKLRPQPGGGIWVDWRFLTKPKFLMSVYMDFLVEARTTGFKQKDKIEYLTADQHLTTLMFAFDLFYRVDFRLAPKLYLYVAAGAEFHLPLMKRIIRDDSKYKETVVDQLSNWGVDVVIATGLYYKFDVNYLFKRKLELGGEVRYTQGVTTYLKGSYLGEEDSLQSQISVFFINTLIDF